MYCWIKRSGPKKKVKADGHCAGGPAACTWVAQAVAQADQREFLQAVASALPEGRAQARSLPSATARNLDVWLLWRDTPVSDAQGLVPAATRQCPQGLSDSDRQGASCMHFRVGL